MTTPAPAPARPPRRKSSRIATIFAERCTGCEACIAVAPHESCIKKASQDLTIPTGMVECIVQPDTCTGCTLCMKICPWDAIEMIPRPPENQ